MATGKIRRRGPRQAVPGVPLDTLSENFSTVSSRLKCAFAVVDPDAGDLLTLMVELKTTAATASMPHQVPKRFPKNISARQKPTLIDEFSHVGCISTAEIEPWRMLLPIKSAGILLSGG